jgi:hypothetical protein
MQGADDSLPKPEHAGNKNGTDHEGHPISKAGKQLR